MIDINGNESKTILEAHLYEEIERINAEALLVGISDDNGIPIRFGDRLKITATANDHNQRGAIEIVTIRKFMGNACACIGSDETGTPLYPAFMSHEKVIINTF